MTKESAIEQSKKYWAALEKSNVDVMRSIADPSCYFVHIGGNCDLDKEMAAFTNKVFCPTEIKLNNQTASVHDNVAVVITDCDYGLLLDGKPTTHHFAVTEVYINRSNEWKLIQFSFTALVY